MELSEESKGILLLSARDSIESLFGEKSQPIIDYNFYPQLKQTGIGVFVTLTKQSQLRGCIGYITSKWNIYETVCDAAIQAASNDPRFPQVAERELSKINIEISIISPLSDVEDYNQIQLGIHGLVLEDMNYHSLLLPQVAAENNFTLSDYLSALCEKAGLPYNEWQIRKLNIKTFTALVFSEVGNRVRTYERY